jgi:hypothetical protein
VNAPAGAVVWASMADGDDQAGGAGPGTRELALVPARAFTRREVRDLHRGTPDEAALEVWRRRAEAVLAARAPEEGPLAANATGWVVGIGDPPQRLFPRLRKLAALASGWAGFGPAMALTLTGSPPWWLLIGLLGGAPVMFTTTIHAAAYRRVTRGQRRRARPLRLPEDEPTGALVRATGVVGSQQAFPALFSGQPAVVCRSRAGTADETRAIDFTLELEAGHRLHVAARDAFLMDEPARFTGPPACGPVSPQHRDGAARLSPDLLLPPAAWHRLFEPRLRESSIGPGDRVEVCGLLHHESAPDGEAAPGRGVPLKTVIAAGPGARLLIRKAT